MSTTNSTKRPGIDDRIPQHIVDKLAARGATIGAMVTYKDSILGLTYTGQLVELYGSTHINAVIKNARGSKTAMSASCITGKAK